MGYFNDIQTIKKGMIAFKDGSQYKGEIKNLMMNGSGILTYKNENGEDIVYEGNFIDNQIDHPDYKHLNLNFRQDLKVKQPELFHLGQESNIEVNKNNL